MPAPAWEFHEREAALEWGYTLAAWSSESTVNKAKCLAHYLHRHMRESYETEMRMNKNSGGKTLPGQSYEALMKSMGLEQ